LQAAIEYDGADADILIAMYRLKDSDDAWQEDVRRRIERLSRGFQKAIDDDAEDPINYNQWAWLVSNTEGDLDQALAYSKKSLELSPDDPGYLDTLGRCYFALEDYENAVKYQRRAVELDPHLQVMRRQLELFESTLAASQKKD
jgi:tetratricopeptide (TPR) repeat protein